MECGLECARRYARESVLVGYVRCRESKVKRRRYTAVYRDVRGVERSAGTFSDRAAAARAWKSAEASVADGRYLDVDQGRKRFAAYARETWLPQYAGEDTTVQGYDFYLEKYLIPEFGATRMIEVAPERVRAFYALLRDSGLGTATIEKCNTVLCSLFNTAVNDRVVGVHPCRGVQAATVVPAKLRVLTPPEFARVHARLRDDHARLMVDVLLESGCRWGEFAELRVGDLDPLVGTITVARTVVEVNPKYTTEGGERVSGEGVSEEQALARRRDQPRAGRPAHRAPRGPRPQLAHVPSPRMPERAKRRRQRQARGAGGVPGQWAQLHPRHPLRVHEGLVPVRDVPRGGGRIPHGPPRRRQGPAAHIRDP